MRELDFSIVSTLHQPASTGPKTRNLIGRKFNRLTPYGFLGLGKTHGARWLCRCDCGEFCIVVAAKLLSGHTKSCGCYKSEETSKRTRTHGQSKTLIYRHWGNMNSRCSNPKVQSYEWYGGKGVKVCQGLRNFETFASVLGEMPSPAHTTDRIDSAGNYACGTCPECLTNGWPMNIRWATQAEQQRNTSRNVFLTIQGITLCVTDWAHRCDLTQPKVWKRLNRGWTPEQALGLTDPPRR